MAGSLNVNDVVNGTGSDSNYKKAVDSAVAYKEAKELDLAKRLAIEELKLQSKLNGATAELRAKLEADFVAKKLKLEQLVATSISKYESDLADIQLAREKINLHKLEQERKNIKKKALVDNANDNLAMINEQIALDAQVAKVKSKNYKAYVNLMQHSDAIREKAKLDAEKEALKNYAKALSQDAGAYAKYKKDSKDRLKALKEELKDANKAKDKDRATQLKKLIADEKKASGLVITETNKQKAEAYREEEAERKKNATFVDGKFNTDKLTDARDAAKADGNIAGQLGASLKLAGAMAWNKAMDSIDDYLLTYTQNFTSITTRLQNSGYTYEGINKLYKQNTAANPYVRYDKLLTKLNDLVEQGIATNVAQRAFLGTIAEEVATTFDATQASLLQIVRIQQSDTTAQRLGLEANLTRLFNFYFGDTSYLSQAFDSIQETLIGTSAQMSADTAIEFEYIVQKWLGSLGSVGVGTSTLQTIAQGVNYLGTGNVESLSGNAALQNLLVMSANRAGLNYGNILTGGLSSTDTNKLLKSLVEYVQEVSSGTNNVVKSAYANLFGVTISDMAAFQNLTSGTINSLYNQVMTSADTMTELDYQLKQAGSRYHLSTKIQNVLDNTFMGVGMGVANSAASYGLYKAADMLEKITGGIQLPAIGIMGNFIDLNMSLESLVKTGVVGFSALGSLVGAVGNIFSGPLNLEKWGLSSNKGEGFRGFTSGSAVQLTTSSASYVSNSNATGTKQSLVDQQKTESSTVNGEEEQENPFSKKATDYGGADYWTNILLAIETALKGTLDVRVTNDITNPVYTATPYGGATTTTG